jgi:predicted dienelactone hydrolase
MPLSFILPLAASLVSLIQPPPPAEPETKPSKPAFTLHPEHAYAPHTPDAPAFEVVTLDLTLRDDARDKDLELRIRAPKLASSAPDAALAPLPLIIFSHGAGGSNDAFPDLSTHWASRGYIVVHPTHSDSIALRRRNGEDLSRLRENPRNLVMDVDAPDRLADCSFIIDSIPAITDALNKDVPEANRLTIDATRIGMAGHSAGAYTTQIAFGAKVRGPRWGSLRLKSHADPRITSAILISGQGTTNRSLTKDSWSDIAGPMMVIAGSLDVSRISDETPESRREPFEYAKPGDKYLIYIDGATHGSYQGKGLATMLRENPTTDIDIITAAVSSGTTAFFDCYLKAADNTSNAASSDISNAAKSYLESDALIKLTSGAAEYKRK